MTMVDGAINDLLITGRAGPVPHRDVAAVMAQAEELGMTVETTPHHLFRWGVVVIRTDFRNSIETIDRRIDAYCERKYS